MKNFILSAVVCSAILMSSCGSEGDKKEAEKVVEKDPMAQMCECFEMAQSVSKEMMEVGGEEDKIKAIEDKYKSQEEECDKLGDAMQEQMKDATEEENRAKMDEFVDACPAAKQMMGM